MASDAPITTPKETPIEASKTAAAPNEAHPNEAMPNEAMPNEGAPAEAMPADASPGSTIPGEPLPSDAASLGREPTPSASEITKAELALALAGRALDPNQGGTDASLGAELCARVVAKAASALGAPAAPSLAVVVSSLDDSLLVRAAGSRDAALRLAARLAPEARETVTLQEMREAELFAAKLLEIAKKAKRLRRATRISRAFKALVLMGIVFAGFYTFFPGWGHHYKYTTSSSLPGYQAKGELPGSISYDIFFHTTDQESPWLEIDLGKERDVSSVRVQNRFDCCTDRAVPLVVSLRTEKGAFHDVAREEENFTIWTAKFPKERARYVRLTVPRKTPFHLRGVDIQ